MTTDSVNDIWAEMKAAEQGRVPKTSKSTSKMNVNAMLNKKKGKNSKKTKKSPPKNDVTPSSHDVGKLNEACVSGAELALVGEGGKEEEGAVVAVSTEDILRLAQRDINSFSAEEAGTRRRALTKVTQIMFERKTPLADDVIEELFSHMLKPLLKRFADPSETCRELAITLTTRCLPSLADLTRALPYLFPALLARGCVMADWSYDPDLMVFVRNAENHEARKRGVALAPDDHSRLVVVEPSEEIRLVLARLLSQLLRCALAGGVGSQLHPYFHDLIIYVQACVLDPYPALRLEACSTLRLVAAGLPQPTRLFAVACVRTVAPLLEHRHAKVRIAAIQTVGDLVAVPYPEKCRGGATECIQELLGQRDENILPVAGFYRPDITLNRIAKLVQDEVPNVRSCLHQTLADWVLRLPDRYDHEARLAPYLLGGLSDPVPAIQSFCLATLDELGGMYVQENQQDVIERRQYGVDGYRFARHGPLPPPFTQRPPLATRLYVRNKCRRFVKPLLKELTSWSGGARTASALLLRSLVVLCEEHVTMELHSVLKQLHRLLIPGSFTISGTTSSSSSSNNSSTRVSAEELETCATVRELCGLLGRFLAPDAYLPLLLPVLGGEESAAGGGELWRRSSALAMLGCLMGGADAGALLPHLLVVARALEESCGAVVEAEDRAGVEWLLAVVEVLVGALKGRGAAAVSAHFLATGRLHDCAQLHACLLRLLLLLEVEVELGVGGEETPTPTKTLASGGGAGAGVGGSGADLKSRVLSAQADLTSAVGMDAATGGGGAGTGISTLFASLLPLVLPALLPRKPTPAQQQQQQQQQQKPLALTSGGGGVSPEAEDVAGGGEGEGNAEHSTTPSTPDPEAIAVSEAVQAAATPGGQGGVWTGSPRASLALLLGLLRRCPPALLAPSAHLLLPRLAAVAAPPASVLASAGVGGVVGGAGGLGGRAQRALLDEAVLTRQRCLAAVLASLRACGSDNLERGGGGSSSSNSSGSGSGSSAVDLWRPHLVLLLQHFLQPEAAVGAEQQQQQQQGKAGRESVLQGLHWSLLECVINDEQALQEKTRGGGAGGSVGGGGGETPPASQHPIFTDTHLLCRLAPLLRQLHPHFASPAASQRSRSLRLAAVLLRRAMHALKQQQKQDRTRARKQAEQEQQQQQEGQQQEGQGGDQDLDRHQTPPTRGAVVSETTMELAPGQAGVVAGELVTATEALVLRLADPAHEPRMHAIAALRELVPCLSGGETSSPEASPAGTVATATATAIGSSLGQALQLGSRLLPPLTVALLGVERESSEVLFRLSGNSSSSSSTLPAWAARPNDEEEEGCEGGGEMSVEQAAEVAFRGEVQDVLRELAGVDLIGFHTLLKAHMVRSSRGTGVEQQQEKEQQPQTAEEAVVGEGAQSLLSHVELIASLKGVTLE